MSFLPCQLFIFAPSKYTKQSSNRLTNTKNIAYGEVLTSMVKYILRLPVKWCAFLNQKEDLGFFNLKPIMMPCCSKIFTNSSIMLFLVERYFTSCGQI
jgi:hypothetical protein